MRTNNDFSEGKIPSNTIPAYTSQVNQTEPLTFLVEGDLSITGRFFTALKPRILKLEIDIITCGLNKVFFIQWLKTKRKSPSYILIKTSRYS